MPARRARPAGASTTSCASSTARVSLVEVETTTASPFASSLLFDYVATYMYEGDTPNAERRAAALRSTASCCASCWARTSCASSSIRTRSIRSRPTCSTAPSARGRPDADELPDVLRRVGDLTAEEVAARVAKVDARPCSTELERRAPRASGPRGRRAALDRRAEDAGLLPRRARRSCRPGGLPAAFLEQVDDRARALVARYASTHGPFTDRRARARYGARPIERAARASSSATATLVRGELRPGGTEREWCDPDVLRRLRRASLAVLRKEIEAADPRALARFSAGLARASTATRAGAGVDRLREALVPLQGLALTADVWERDVLPAASAPTHRPGSTSCAHRASSSGSAPVRSAGPVAACRCCSARTPTLLGRRRQGRAAAEPPHEPIRELPRAPGPRFFTDLLGDVPRAPRGAAGGALGPRLGGRGNERRLRAAARPAPHVARDAEGRRGTARRERLGAGARGAQAPVQGRWSDRRLSAAPPIRGERRTRTSRATARAQRHRDREQVLAEGIPGGFSAVYRRARRSRDAGCLPPRLLRRGARRTSGRFSAHSWRSATFFRCADM